MITRTIPRPVFISTSPGIIDQYKAEGVKIAVSPQDSSKLLITAPDDAAADAAEVWLFEMQAPSD